MNRSSKSSMSEAGKSKNQSYGTLAPTMQPPSGNAPSQVESGIGAPAVPPAYQTYSPPTGPGGTEKDLPNHATFQQVFKTNGTDTECNLLDAYGTQFDDDNDGASDDGDCIETMEVPMDRFKDSDFISTIELPADSVNRILDPKQSDSFRTIDLPDGGTGQLNRVSPSGGKSSWQLQIREKSIKGYVSGVRNRIPNRNEEAEGFLNAFVDNPEIPEYDVLSELGKGNMGIVYEARQSSLNRELAIKSLKPKEGSARYEQEMFVSEAVVTANLVHPNIVPIHDLGRTDDGKLFYSMKKVMGVSWDKTIREKSLEDNLDIFMKMCDAVAYAHSRGVVNRDLKPENVVVGAYGEVIVLDWGLAVTNERFPKPESILLDYRGGAGTPVYMAPELVSDDISAIGEHSDIYLLGAILFELLEGFPPHLLREFWELENPQEQFASIVTAVMTNQIERQVTHPGELMDIAFKAMATNPVHRFQTVEEMQECIRQYRITGHAEEFYRAAETGDKNQNYDNFQASVALFSEALRKWPNNERATLGDKIARKGFAELALLKGDFDLGIHLIEGNEEPEFNSLRKNLSRSRGRRTLIKRTWSVLAVGIVGLGLFTAFQFQQLEAKTTLAQMAESSAKKEKEKADVAIAEAKTESAKAEKALEKATQAEKLTDIADKKTEAAEKLLVETEEEIKVVKAEADEQSKIAMKETEKAKAAKEIADTEIKKAEEAKKLAADETKKAKGALDAVKKANKELAKAEADMKIAEKAKIQAQINLLDTEWNRFNLEFDLFVQLGQFEEALDVVKSALAKSEIGEGEVGFNPEFVRRRRAIITKARDLRDRRTSQIRSVEGDLKTAAIGATGRVIAYATPTKIEILYTPVGLPTSVANLKSVAFEDLKGRVHLAISADEKLIVATGRNYKRVWSLKNGEPVDYALTDQFPSESTPQVTDYKVAHFGPDSKSLYLISNDDRLTMEIYDVSSGFPKPLTRTSIAGKSNNDSTITDFFVVPGLTEDVSAGDLYQLVYLTSLNGTSTCRSVQINHEEKIPVLENDEAFDDSRSGQLRQEEMKGLIVSRDYQRMAIRIGDKNIQVFERTTSGVPYQPIKGSAFVECDTTITSFEFSTDGQQLLAGTKSGYLELWQWNQGEMTYAEFQPSDDLKLWKEHRIGGLSANPLQCSFVGAGSDNVLAIGLTDQGNRESGHSIVNWNLPDYDEYQKSIANLGEKLFEVPIFLKDKVQAKSADSVTRVDAESFTSKIKPVIDFSALQSVAVYQDEEASEEKDSEEKVLRWPVSRSAESAKFSQDGQRIIVAADDRAAHVFARNKATVMIAGGRRSRFYEPDRNIFEEGHIPELSEIMFLPPDGSRLLTKDFFGAVSVWDASIDEDGYAREVSRMLTSDFGLAVSPDGRWVVASARDSKEEVDENGKLVSRPVFVARVWDTKDFESNPSPDAVRTFGGMHERLITAIAVSPDSTTIVTADRRGHIVVWDMMTAEVIAEINGQHENDQISGIEFLNNNELISTGFDGRVRRWTIKQKDLEEIKDPRFAFLRESGIDDYIISLKISPNRRQFSTVSVKTGGRNQDRKTENLVRLTVWSVDTPQESKDLFSKPWPVNVSEFDQGVSWSIDGKTLAHIYPVTTTTLGNDLVSELSLYDTETWKVTRKYQPKGLTGTASKIAFSPVMHADNKEQIATFDGRVAHLWKLGDGDHLAEFRSHETVYSADFSSDRMLVATASDSLRIFISDERSNNHGSTIIRITDAHSGRVEEVEFTDKPDKYDFLSLGGDRKIKLWNWDWKRNEASNPPAQPAVTINLAEDQTDADSPWDKSLQWTSSLNWSPSENLIAATFAGDLHLYQRQGEIFEEIELKLPEEFNVKFNSCAISADEKQIAAGGVRLLEDGRTLESFSSIWTLRDGQPPLLNAIFKGNHSPNRNSDQVAGTTAIAFGPDGFTLLTGGTDGTLLEWDWDDRKADSDEIPEGDQFTSYKVENENPHTATINSIDVSKKGDIITSGGDGHVAFWPAIDLDL